MLASRYADPDAVAAESPKRKDRLSVSHSKSGSTSVGGEAQSTSTQEHGDVTASQTENLLASAVEAERDETSDRPTQVRQELSSDGGQQESGDDQKPLPPLPHDEEVQKNHNLPEPSVVLASSPGATTPEILPTTPQLTPSIAPRPQTPLQSSKTTAESSIPVETTKPDPTPKPVSPAPPAAITRARRSKAGRPCTVRLPTDKNKTYSGYLVPMSREDFMIRVDNLEKAGYDTRGFGYWKDAEGIDMDTRPAQARGEFPDPEEQKRDRQQREFSVSVPDMRKWDDYVNMLMEEKLRSLGVTPGNDDPTPPTMSRQISSQYPALPSSPPIPSSSAASQHIWQNAMPFSAPFSPAGSTNNTSIGPVASPAPSLGKSAYPGHIPRQSTFGFPFPNSQAQFGAHPQPQPWSPQQMNNIQPLSRGASPAVFGGMNRTTSGLSQEAPSTPGERQTTPRGQIPAARTNSRPEQALSWRSNLPSARVTNSDPQIDDNAKDDSKTDTYADLASPKPQGHRHNISQNLEREAENAQYYPGEYVNESRENSPQRQVSVTESAKKESTHQPKSRHVSNVSMSSRLNIEAKEFKFDPASSSSRNFSMTHDAFLPSTSTKSAKAADATSSVQLATAHSHQGSVSLSNFNVTAPEFKPPAQKNFAFSSSWFNFTAKKPNEQPSETQAVEGFSAENKPSTFSSRIFGNIADIVKPSKKSKAVPIVDPKDVEDEKEAGDDTYEEDEDGRIGPSGLRRKKGRFGRGDEDEVPRFAEPTPEPQSSTPAPEQSAVDETRRPDDSAFSTRVSEQDIKDSREHHLTLDDELGQGEDLSDGSDVPWHGVEGDDRLEVRERSSHTADADLLTSPAPPSGIEEFEPSRDTRGLSPKSPTSRPEPSFSGENFDNDDSLVNPSAEELDAVMDYINKDISEFDEMEEPPISQMKNAASEASSVQAMEGTTEPIKKQRHLAQSKHQSVQEDSLIDGTISQARDRALEGRHELSRPKSASLARQGVSPVRKLNRMAEGSVSDWNDMLSSGEELKIPPQKPLNDAHVAALVEGLLRRHLAPFEKQLSDLSASFKRSATDFGRPRPISSYEKSESDADDEDETDAGSRLHSRGGPKSERRTEHIRAAVMDAMAASQSSGLGQIEQEARLRKAAESRADDLQRLLSLSEREISLLKEAGENSDEKVRNLEQEQTDLSQRHKAVEEELRTKTLNFTAEVAALENTVDEYRTSSTKWRAEIDSVKKAREELEKNIQKLKSESDETHRDREELNSKLARAEEGLKSANSTLETERSAWERKDQRHSSEIESLQSKLTETLETKDRLNQAREELDEKFVKAEEELKTVNTKLMTDKSTWELKDQKQNSEIESLRGKLEEVVQTKDHLNEELSRLSQVEKNSIKNAVILEETQNAKSRLEESVNKLNEKVVEHQTIVARYEREASEAHENTSLQVERTKRLMQTDIDIAEKKVENIRADLETRLQMVRSELDNVRKDNESVRSRYEKSLNDAIASRKEVLQEAADSSKSRLQEERGRFEQSLNELSSQHDRALRNAIEDKQRSETYLNSNLRLAESKISHLEDQVHQLEEKLSVAQSAAQAAAIAAQSAKSHSESLPQVSASRNAPTATITTPSHLDKVSPQALRESIVVLQEQLQEREARIESLESEITTIGRDAPAKLEERDTEIGWLRELLGLRVDDLTELVHNLQMEKFDRGAARNAAIRIKANLQMQQQEKDRVLHGVKPTASAPTLPSLTDIQNFASPKAAQLTSAFNNWRKTGQTPSLAGLREAVNANTPSRPSVATARTERSTKNPTSDSLTRQDQNNGTSLKNPIAASAAANAAKSAEPQSFLSGLMTPPASNVRRTPSTGAGSAQTERPRTPVRPGSSGSPVQKTDPTTPPLMRKGDYDLDAELGPDRMEFEESQDDDGGDDGQAEPPVNAAEETIARTKLEPFGEVMASFSTSD